MIDPSGRMREGLDEEEPNGCVSWEWNGYDVVADAGLGRQCSGCDSRVEPVYKLG